MDNRRGLISDMCVTPSLGVTEPEAALALVARQRLKRLRHKSAGGDKGYHRSRFDEALRAQRIAAHVAINAAHYTTGPGPDRIFVCEAYHDDEQESVCQANARSPTGRLAFVRSGFHLSCSTRW
jgi:hypothetical protein